jgi:hypothetical protein
MCLRRAPEKYIAGAALDRAVLDGWDVRLVQRCTWSWGVTCLWDPLVPYIDSGRISAQIPHFETRRPWKNYPPISFPSTRTQQKTTLKIFHRCCVNVFTELLPSNDNVKHRQTCRLFFFKFQFILQSVVIHLAECYGEGVLQCLGERPSVGPVRR